MRRLPQNDSFVQILQKGLVSRRRPRIKPSPRPLSVPPRPPCNALGPEKALDDRPAPTLSWGRFDGYDLVAELDGTEALHLFQFSPHTEALVIPPKSPGRRFREAPGRTRRFSAGPGTARTTKPAPPPP